VTVPLRGVFVQKSRQYRNVKFDAKTITAADAGLGDAAREYGTLKVSIGGDEWVFGTLAEFLAAVDQCSDYFFSAYSKNRSKNITIQCGAGLYGSTSVTISAPDREQIERLASIFDNDAERCRLPEKPDEKKEVKVFIGHGQDPQWKDLKDHLHEKHGYSIEAYEIGSRAGHSIRDVLEEMLDESSFALLVMTGEDEDKEGKLHARENVIHETGLFQGNLGFSRAIVLLEGGTEEFSNLAGIQQIRFTKGNIKEAFGDVLAVLKRELG
jgi:predicted nucleotide-binding protein